MKTTSLKLSKLKELSLEYLNSPFMLEHDPRKQQTLQVHNDFLLKYVQSI